MSTWVSEMRTKSPATLSKWIDPASNETTCETVGIDDSINSKDNSEQTFTETQPQPETLNQQENSSTFWRRGPSIITTTFASPTKTSPEELQANLDSIEECENENPNTSTATTIQSVLSRAKISEFYNKLNINRKRYGFIKERRMAAREILNEAKERFMRPKSSETIDKGDVSDNEKDLSSNEALQIDNATLGCDSAIEMDASTEEISHLSQSIDNMSINDSCHLSMQSISDGLLNVGRKACIGEIGRSTSDNPRAQNKVILADIGRSFSEHQDDEAILIGERNISAPSSSIAIHGSRPNRGHLERRAYSVSPTQRNLKRGILMRDHSLCESPSRNILRKENSFQSDSSHCSSVESLLDARKPDPEAILRHLGFGPVQQEDMLSRIPQR